MTESCRWDIIALFKCLIASGYSGIIHTIYRNYFCGRNHTGGFYQSGLSLPLGSNGWNWHSPSLRLILFACRFRGASIIDQFQISFCPGSHSVYVIWACFYMSSPVVYGSYYQVHGGRGLIPSSVYNLGVFNNMSLFQLDILWGQRAEGGERKQKKKLTWLKTYFGKQIRDKTKTLLTDFSF